MLESNAPAAPGSDQTGEGWEVQPLVMVGTAGASAQVAGAFSRHTSGSGVSRIARGFAASTVDLKSAKALDVTIQFGSSNANNKVRIESAVVERIA